MFALSRDGEKLFLHQPDAGMVVPILLDFRHKKLAVRVPSVDELENDYAVYDGYGEMLRAVSDSHRVQVEAAGQFSRECSKVFRDQISTGRLTVAELRKLVQGHVRHITQGQSVARKTAAAAPASEAFPVQEEVRAYDTMVDAYARSFSQG